MNQPTDKPIENGKIGSVFANQFKKIGSASNCGGSSEPRKSISIREPDVVSSRPIRRVSISFVLVVPGWRLTAEVTTAIVKAEQASLPFGRIAV
jgi:hypothetical protein